MIVFFNIFSTLVTACLGHWLCGHCVMVLKYGGPQGIDSSPYQRKFSPFRFWLYLAVYGALGIACVFMTLGQFVRLWELVMLFINAD
jgi:hypothetical protein